MENLVAAIVLVCNLKTTNISNKEWDCIDFLNNCAVKINKIDVEKKDIDECIKKWKNK